MITAMGKEPIIFSPLVVISFVEILKISELL